MKTSLSQPWSFLATLFAAPLDDDGLLAARRELAALMETSEPSSWGEAWIALSERLDALPEGREGRVALEHAYVLLFSGAGGPRATPPYESAFTEPKGRLFGDAESRMRALLTRLDLRVADGTREPADHIAIELTTMAEMLASDLPKASCDELATQMKAWLSGFRDACRLHDPLGVYAAAAAAAFALAQRQADRHPQFQEEVI